jgi:hypothetical protein
MDEVQELWREHQQASYPDGYRGVDVGGVELVLLDADIAGCVSTFLGDQRRLDPQRIAILGRCYRDALRVTQELEGEARDYFGRLEHLAGAVLKELSVERAV